MVYSDVPQIQFLSEEDECALATNNDPPPQPRKSYEGAIRYASLLWDKTKSSKSSKSKEGKSAPESSLPADDMTAPLIE